MIIGFDGSRAFVKDRTGTENYSYQILKNLSKIDPENKYLVYFRPGSKIEDKWPANFSFKVINLPRLWTQLGLALRTFIDPLDVLFVPAHTLPLLRKPSLKTVMSVHDLGAEYLPKTHQLKQRLYLGFITKFQLKSATKLIAMSKATKDDLIKKVGIDPKRIEVVYEAVDQKFFKPVKGELLVNSLNKFSIENGKYFLFVGTIQPRKNLNRLIEAFSKLEDGETRLVLAGGKGWLSDGIYQLPEKLGISNRVKFLGKVEDKDLSSLYSGAIALCYPSLFEGFGLPILEAWACHCPVLTSNHPPMSEIAGDAAILVEAYDTFSISSGMKKILGKAERLKLIENGKIRLEDFSWAKAAQQTLEVIGG